MHATSGSNVWLAVSRPYDDYGRVAVFHWNGTSYTQHDFTSSNIPVNMGTNIFTYGSSDTYLWTGNEIAHWNGTAWSVVFTNPYMDGEGALMGGTSSLQLYLALRLYGGDNGGVDVWRGSGTSWTNLYQTVLDPFEPGDPTTIYHPGEGVVGFRTANPSGEYMGGAARCIAARENVSAGTQRYCVLEVSTNPVQRLYLAPSVAMGMNSLSYAGGFWYFVGQRPIGPIGSQWMSPFIVVSPSWSEITESPYYSYPNVVTPRSYHGASASNMWMGGEWSPNTLGVFDHGLFLDHNVSGTWGDHNDMIPAIAPFHSLNQVFAISTTDVWAIGQLCDIAPTTFVYHYNGTAWTRRDLPPGS